MRPGVKPAEDAAMDRRSGRGRPRAGPRVAPGPPGPGFLYAHVAAELRRRIEEGVYPPGAVIPSEAELVREFGVSAITVRRAIRDLTFEGALCGRQGRGVFVTDRRRIVRVFAPDSRTSFGDEIRRAGLQPGLKELSFEPTRDAGVRHRLALPAEATVYRHEKLILADGEPVSIETLDLPAELAGRLRNDLSEDFVFALLARHGVAVGRTEFRFEGAAVSEAHAALLGLPLRFPVILVHYTLFTPAERPILAGVTVARSDRFTFALTLAPAPPPAAPA